MDSVRRLYLIRPNLSVVMSLEGISVATAQARTRATLTT